MGASDGTLYGERAKFEARRERLTARRREWPDGEKPETWSRTDMALLQFNFKISRAKSSQNMGKQKYKQVINITTYLNITYNNNNNKIQIKYTHLEKHE